MNLAELKTNKKPEKHPYFKSSEMIWYNQNLLEAQNFWIFGSFN